MRQMHESSAHFDEICITLITFDISQHYLCYLIADCISSGHGIWIMLKFLLEDVN